MAKTKPIDSYRVGGSGIVHFYSGAEPVLSAPGNSAQVAAKMQEIDAARSPEPDKSLRDYWRPVVDATTAEPKTRPAFSFSAPPIRPGANLAASPPMPPAAPPSPSMSPADSATMMASLQGQGHPPPGIGGGPPPRPPMPPPQMPGAMPMGASQPPPIDALDEAYRRSQMDTGARFR